MLKWLIKHRLAAFERTFEYDMSYAREILAADTRAFLKFARVMGMTSYRKDVPLDVYYAVKLTGTVAEDCGPCTQLMVAMALRDGAAPRTLSTILAGAPESAEVTLAVAFAKASLAHAPAADALRDDILRLRFFAGLLSKRRLPTAQTARPVRINGLPGFVLHEPEGIETIALEIDGECIVALYAIRNPDKLRHVS